MSSVGRCEEDFTSLHYSVPNLRYQQTVLDAVCLVTAFCHDAGAWSLATTAVFCDSLLQRCFNMSSTERHEVGEDCETVDAVESASEGFEYSEELKLLVEKWSRYSVACF